MNRDEKIEQAIIPLTKMYEKIENDLLKEISSHFSINEEFLNSDYWRIKKLEEMSLFNEDVIKYLSKYTKKTEIEIKKALNQIGVNTVNLNKLNRLFEDEVLKINPDILANNYTIKNIINNAYNELSNKFIEMSSKIEKSTREAYLNVVEEAYLKTTMGTHSYQEAIKESINNLSNEGIKILTYKTLDENGNVVGLRSYDIEVAVRREVLTASRQLSNNISMEVANELECEYLYLSEHLQCRPTHFDWQGTIIKREDLIKVTHYGDVDGLAGINCRHYFEPYFGDARDDELKHFNKEECEKAYKTSQQQRYLERGIRKWERKAEMFKASEDLDSYSKCQDKVKEWQLKNQNFTKENNLKRDFVREYVSGFKSENINNIMPKKIINNLKEINIIPDSSLLKMDSQLLEENVIQFNKLAKKYNMQEFLDTMDTTYMCSNKKSVASVGYNSDMSQMFINSSTKFFKDKTSYDNVIKDSDEIGWCMPCPKENKDIYVMTHEMGHVLEMKMFKNEYPFGGTNEYKLFCNKVKDDIIDIAKKNKKFNYEATISEYGDKKSSDFFAEIFASMEVGYSNSLSKAMKKYLKERGII